LVDEETISHRTVRTVWIIGSLCVTNTNYLNYFSSILNSCTLVVAIYAIYSVYSRRTGYTILDGMEELPSSKPGSGYSLPSFSVDTITRYFKRPFRSRRTNLRYRYDPLLAEEYEIPDIEDGAEDEDVVDFQHMAVLEGAKKNLKKNIGYGTVR